MIYTVVGIYDDNQQIWVEIVDAISPGQAIILAGESIVNRNRREMDPYNILIVSVFEGRHQDRNETEAVAALPDFPGWEE